MPPFDKDAGCGSTMVEAEAIVVVEPSVIENEDSVESTRLTTLKRRRFCKQYCCRFVFGVVLVFS